MLLMLVLCDVVFVVVDWVMVDDGNVVVEMCVVADNVVVGVVML